MMDYVARDDEGFMLWACPVCGRRILYRMNPFDKIVVEAGDEKAAHGGSTGKMKVTAETIIHGRGKFDKDFLDDAGITWDEAP